MANSTALNSTAKDSVGRARLAASGGILGALAASTCCIIPLVLFSLGVSGAWIGRLTALSAYQPYVLAITAGMLGYGYWLVYFRAPSQCAEEQACAQPLPGLIVKSALWFATALVLLAVAWPYILPLVLG